QPILDALPLRTQNAPHGLGLGLPALAKANDRLLELRLRLVGEVRQQLFNVERRELLEVLLRSIWHLAPRGIDDGTLQQAQGFTPARLVHRLKATLPSLRLAPARGDGQNLVVQSRGLRSVEGQPPEQDDTRDRVVHLPDTCPR